MIFFKNNKFKLIGLFAFSFIINNADSSENYISTFAEAEANLQTDYTVYLDSSGVSAEQKLYELCRYSSLLVNAIAGTEEVDKSNNFAFFPTSAKEIYNNYQNIYFSFLNNLKRKDLEFIRDRVIANSFLFGSSEKTMSRYFMGILKDNKTLGLNFTVKLTSKESFVLDEKTSDGLFIYKLPHQQNFMYIFSGNYLGKELKELDLKMLNFSIYKTGKPCFVEVE